ncbi:RNA-binding S4 domain-containing protein [Novosphingobium sp. NPDC080210]|jgi:ribosome-associated heat shock protein Hsp15|uniref:RNA-binding S4 domain-containing protein n=1 Tax=unclassified Novosphingobium TaxID=2644732 RepID=UPI0032402ED9
MRIDKLLWFLRLAKTRSAAQSLVCAGHIRLNGKRIERSAQAVSVGDVMVIPLPRGVAVIELTAMPERRGPAPEAQACYRVLDGTGGVPLAAPENNSP